MHTRSIRLERLAQLLGGVRAGSRSGGRSILSLNSLPKTLFGRWQINVDFALEQCADYWRMVSRLSLLLAGFCWQKNCAHSALQSRTGAYRTAQDHTGAAAKSLRSNADYSGVYYGHHYGHYSRRIIFTQFQCAIWRFGF